MATNFTPLDVQKFRENNNLINIILLSIATLTTFVLVTLLFILIQKKVQTTVETKPIQPTIITPTPKIMKPSPTLFVSPPVATSSPTPEATPSGRACTQEAKICPDGTGVGRTGPNCEFAPCPTKTATESPTIVP